MAKTYNLLQFRSHFRGKSNRKSFVLCSYALGSSNVTIDDNEWEDWQQKNVLVSANMSQKKNDLLNDSKRNER